MPVELFIAFSGKQPPMLMGECAGGDSFSRVSGATFNDEEITAMSSVVDSICSSLKIESKSQDRELVAWLVVRLSRNGVCDTNIAYAAACDALSRRV